MSALLYPPEPTARVIERGRHRSVVESLRQMTNESGQLLLQTNRYTVVQNGLNRRDASGRWVESKPVAQSYSEGIVCTGTGMRVILNRNLNTPNAVDLESEGIRIVSRPSGIAYFDPETGRRVILARVKDCEAQTISNQVVFLDAFEPLAGSGIKASVTYSYAVGRFAQDVTLLRQPLLTPADLGMGSRARLEILTEIVEWPSPTIVPRPLKSETNSVMRARMVEPDLVDQTLRFGDELMMRLGRAFQSEIADRSPLTGVPVAKRLMNINGRTMLIEAVEWNDVRGELRKLPRQARSLKSKDASRQASLRKKSSDSAQKLYAHHALDFETRLARVTGSTLATYSVASTRDVKGFVIDYEIVQNGYGQEVFESGETYLIAGYASLWDPVFEAGAFIKFNPYSYMFIGGDHLASSARWPSGTGRAIFTSKDDNTVGATISGSQYPTISRFSGPALIFEYIGYDCGARNVDIRHAQIGLAFYSDYEADWVVNSHFSNCDLGIYFENTHVSLEYVDFCNVTTWWEETACPWYCVGGDTLSQCNYGPPYANVSSIQMCRNSTPVSYNLSGWSPRNWPLTYTVLTTPSHGRLSYSYGTLPTVWYWPTSGYEGTDSFTFKVSDGFGESSPATVTVDVGYQPLANGQTVQTCRGMAKVITLTGYDGCGDSLTFIKVSDPTHGTLSTITPINGSSASIIYTPSSTPSPGYCGQDSFTFKVNDGIRDSDPATVTVNVGDPNPTANCAGAITGKGNAVNIILSGADNCSDSLTFAIVPNSGPNNGQLGTIAQIDATHASVTYTPDASFTGSDWFSFTVNNCGFSSGANYAFITVLNPPLLTAVCGPDRILLRLTVSPQMASLDTDFQIKRSTSPGGPYTVIHTADATDRSYVDTTVQTGVTYCYIVTLRRQDSCTSVFYEVASNEICIQTCAEPPCTSALVTGWVFTDEGFIAGGQNGTFRSYNSPASVTASPWSFPSSSGSVKVRMDYEDDGNCTSPPFNGNIQTATAEAVIVVASDCSARLIVDWAGMIEQENSGYERMWLYVDGNQIDYAQSTEGEQDCAPMVAVTDSQEVVLQAGFHFLRINIDTGTDGLFHFDAYYQFDIELQSD